jgi:hypothetical protein
MLSLVGSIQPDPFSPEHTSQTKPDQAQSPQPPPYPVLPDSVGSEATDDEEMGAITVRPSPAVTAEGERRGSKDGNEVSLATREKKKREKEKTKRKRNDDGVVAKSDHRQKRKKAS